LSVEESLPNSELLKGTVGAPVVGGDDMTEAAIPLFPRQIENEIMIASAAKEKS
jgi:hypothetical protein